MSILAWLKHGSTIHCTHYSYSTDKSPCARSPGDNLLDWPKELKTEKVGYVTQLVHKLMPFEKYCTIVNLAEKVDIIWILKTWPSKPSHPIVLL